MARTLKLLSALLLTTWLSGAGCTLDGFMFAGVLVDGPYDFSDTTIPADKFDPEGTFVTAEDGTRVHLHYVQSSGDATGSADTTVFYCHGNSENIMHYWHRVEMLYEMGYQVLIFDYRGYGRSADVKTTEPGVYQDAEAAYAHLLTLPDVNPDKIVFYGYSLGCAVCTEMAYRYSDQPAALLLEAPFRSVKDLVQDSAGASLDVGMLADMRFDNIGKIDKIGAPLLVMHGQQDDYIQPAYGEDLFERALPPKQLWLVPGADHGGVPGEDDPVRYRQYESRVTSFIDQHVP